MILPTMLLLSWLGRASLRRATPRRYLSSTRITYLTDVEGDRDYLERWIERSRCVDWKNGRMEFRHNDTSLVFGGDVCDQGGSDLWVLRTLLEFKQRNPDKVHFVLGNRDINKMRIQSELTVEEHPGVVWNRPEEGVSRDLVERLKWILSGTMGSPRAFGHRQWEIGTDVEENVVESYREACHPEGEMGQYLRQAKLCLRLGKVLFVHGSLPWVDGRSEWDWRHAMPWLEPGEDTQVDTLDDWIEALNQFSEACIQNWVDQPIQLPLWSDRMGYEGHTYGSLIQYGMGMTPDRKKNPTIVYSSWSNDGMPRRFFDDSSDFCRFTRSFLERTGVQVICSGHQPQGDMPNVIRVGDLGWIWSCDTSYSGDTHWVDRENPGREGARSGRGPNAVSEVIFELDEEGNVVQSYCHGVLSDGTEYETKPLGSESKLPVGQLAPHSTPDDPWWVRAAFMDGTHLLSQGSGFDAWNRIVV